MVFNSNSKRPRPLLADYLRAVAYSAVLTWAILFTLFPPTAYTSGLDLFGRLLWVGGCGIGAAMAMSGALTRLDLKLELPGLIFMSVGPAMYTLAQAWLTVYPPAGVTDPNARIALIAYASIPFFMSLPRMSDLYSESQRAKSLRRELGVPKRGKR